MSEKVTAIHRYANPETGVVVEGRYTRVDPPESRVTYWKLTHWRLVFITPSPVTTSPVGQWYKIHGNQKKDLGTQKLIRDAAPDAETALTRLSPEQRQHLAQLTAAEVEG